MKLFKIAFLPLLAGILLLPAASRPVRAAGSAAVEAGAGDRKRDKKKKQEADTAAKATPYEKLFKDKRVETVRGGGLTLHLTADKLYLELPDSLLGRGLMITTTIERTGDPGDGLAPPAARAALHGRVRPREERHAPLHAGVRSGG